MLALLAEHRAALVAEMKTTFFDEVNGKLDGLQKASDSHDERPTSLEDNAKTLHQRLAEVEANCVTLQACNEKLKAKLTDMEGRKRRNNVRIVGLPEGIEGPQPSKFFFLAVTGGLWARYFPVPARIGPCTSRQDP